MRNSFTDPFPQRHTRASTTSSESSFAALVLSIALLNWPDTYPTSFRPYLPKSAIFNSFSIGSSGLALSWLSIIIERTFIQFIIFPAYALSSKPCKHYHLVIEMQILRKGTERLFLNQSHNWSNKIPPFPLIAVIQGAPCNRSYSVDGSVSQAR